MSARDEIIAAAESAGYEVGQYDDGTYCFELGKVSADIRFSKSGVVMRGTHRIGVTVDAELWDAKDKRAAALAWFTR